MKENNEELSNMYGISEDLLQSILDSIDMPRKLKQLITPLHPSDIATLVQQSSSTDREKIIHVLKKDFNPEILSHLDEALREEVFESLGTKKIAEAITELESDDAIDVLEDLEDEERSQILDSVSAHERFIFEQSLSFPEESAGRLMKREFVAVPAHWKVSTVQGFLDKNKNQLPQQFHAIFIVDEKYKPIGKISLSSFIQAPKQKKMLDLIEGETQVIPVNMNQEDVAYLFRHYNLITAPVVNEDDRLLGVITVDDIVYVINEEAEKDFMALGGVRERDIYRDAINATRTRFYWLILNLLTAIIASMVISAFDQTIEKMVALAVLMPIVASMGGNAGTQTLTVVIRALATKEISSSNPFRMIWKETLIGTLNGAIFAFLTGSIVWLWFASFKLGLVAAGAMVINMICAGLAGIIIPLGLDRMKIDPAIASSVFVTTITDVIGFCTFLGFAAMFLM